MNKKYRSISDLRKEAKRKININNGKYMCTLERKNIPTSFAFRAAKNTLIEVIEHTMTSPIVVARELSKVTHVDIRNYG
jgi:hypothetical protein